LATPTRTAAKKRGVFEKGEPARMPAEKRVGRWFREPYEEETISASADSSILEEAGNFTDV
jgi:hypothetical protein